MVKSQEMAEDRHTSQRLTDKKSKGVYVEGTTNTHKDCDWRPEAKEESSARRIHVKASARPSKLTVFLSGTFP